MRPQGYCMTKYIEPTTSILSPPAPWDQRITVGFPLFHQTLNKYLGAMQGRIHTNV